MELPSYFKDFLQDIRPTKSQREDYQSGHKTLRDRLKADEDLNSLFITTFLQGSYRRATAVRPSGDKRPDVDVIVVTRMDESEFSPFDALERFRPFLEKHYRYKYECQGRSIAIDLSYVSLDLVVTSAPSEAEVEAIKEAGERFTFSDDMEDDRELVFLIESVRKASAWRLEPLRIPDRDAGHWEDTHPLEQIRWTYDKNRNCNSHYVNVVKALKWWRQSNPGMPKYPKSYPFEHLIGDLCPEGINSVSEGVVKSLEAIAALTGKPQLPDRGVPSNDVMRRVTDEEFDAFLEKVSPAATLARQAFDSDDLCESARKWKELFGSAFPDPPEGMCDEGKGLSGYSARDNVSVIDRKRFA